MDNGQINLNIQLKAVRESILIFVREFANTELPVPLFSVVHGEFKVVIKNGLFAETMPVADSILESCSTPRSRAKIVAFVGNSKNHVMSQIVASLVADGKLKMTMPDKPKSSNQKFVKAVNGGKQNGRK